MKFKEIERKCRKNSTFGCFRACRGIRKVDEKAWQKHRQLAQLSSANPNRWRIKNNALYFSRRVARVGEVCFVSLTNPSQDAECEKMDDNQFRLNFDIHPKQQAMLMVESLSAQSNIVRLTW